jgi:hypothetical protein
MAVTPSAAMVWLSAHRAVPFPARRKRRTSPPAGVLIATATPRANGATAIGGEGRASSPTRRPRASHSHTVAPAHTKVLPSAEAAERGCAAGKREGRLRCVAAGGAARESAVGWTRIAVMLQRLGVGEIGGQSGNLFVDIKVSRGSREHFLVAAHVNSLLGGN